MLYQKALSQAGGIADVKPPAYCRRVLYCKNRSSHCTAAQNTAKAVHRILGGAHGQGILKHGAAYVLFAAILVAIVPVALQAETADDIASLNRQISQLYGQGKYAEAAALAREALSLTERVLGKEHPDTLTSVNNLAELYDAEGRLAEAEPLFKRALEAFERVLGKDHPNTLGSVNNLAELYQAEGRLAEAEPLLKRALEAREL